MMSVWTRYEFDLTRSQLIRAISMAALAIGLQALIGHTQYLYRGRHGLGTFDEAGAVSATVLGTAALLLGFDLALADRLVPASTPLVGGTVALVLMLGRRYHSRRSHERRLRPDRQVATPVLLFGAGSAGHDLTRAILRDPTSTYVPVGLLDDDPDKRHLRVHGVALLGSRQTYRPRSRRPAPPPSSSPWPAPMPTLIREVQRISLEAGAAFKVVPSVGELLDNRARLADVRDVQISDLLGRRQRVADLAPIAGYLAGKRVLVTRGGRLDRLRTVPADPAVPPGRADHAGPGRVGAARGAAVVAGPGPARLGPN